MNIFLRLRGETEESLAHEPQGISNKMLLEELGVVFQLQSIVRDQLQVSRKLSSPAVQVIRDMKIRYSDRNPSCSHHQQEDLFWGCSWNAIQLLFISIFSLLLASQFQGTNLFHRKRESSNCHVYLMVVDKWYRVRVKIISS